MEVLDPHRGRGDLAVEPRAKTCLYHHQHCSQTVIPVYAAACHLANTNKELNGLFFCQSTLVLVTFMSLLLLFTLYYLYVA